MNKIDRVQRERISKAAYDIKDNPRQALKKLASSNFYKMRVGKYRVIIDLQDYEIRIFVVDVGLRKNIYD